MRRSKAAWKNSVLPNDRPLSRRQLGDGCCRPRSMTMTRPTLALVSMQVKISLEMNIFTVSNPLRKWRRRPRRTTFRVTRISTKGQCILKIKHKMARAAKPSIRCWASSPKSDSLRTSARKSRSCATRGKTLCSSVSPWSRSPVWWKTRGAGGSSLCWLHRITSCITHTTQKSNRVLETS